MSTQCISISGIVSEQDDPKQTELIIQLAREAVDFKHVRKHTNGSIVLGVCSVFYALATYKH